MGFQSTCNTATGGTVSHPTTTVSSLQRKTNGYRSVVTRHRNMCVKVSTELLS